MPQNANSKGIWNGDQRKGRVRLRWRWFPDQVPDLCKMGGNSGGRSKRWESQGTEMCSTTEKSQWFPDQANKTPGFFYDPILKKSRGKDGDCFDNHRTGEAYWFLS